MNSVKKSSQVSIKIDQVNIKQVHHDRVLGVETDYNLLRNKNIDVAKKKSHQ